MPAAKSTGVTRETAPIDQRVVGTFAVREVVMDLFEQHDGVPVKQP
jgi:hypothetical protein